jgi:starch synthase
MSQSILFATAELSPLARVGGLAEATSGLVRALRNADVDITPVLPDYQGISLDNETSWQLSMPPWAGPALARRGHADGVGDIILVDFPGISRPHPYVDPATNEPWPDNDSRFITFAAAVAALTEQLDPDVLHLNDWHTASTVGFLASPPPVVLTIHTLGYQGVTDASWLSRWPIEPWRFAWYDVANPLVGAIRSADAIIAVSPNYAAEILRPETGMGMHDELARRGDALVGIRNGIDVSVWDPEHDDILPTAYGFATLKNGKTAARAALLKRAGWDDDGSILISVVSRLVDQKGMDLIVGLVPYLRGIGARIFLLGSGTPEITNDIRSAADAHPDVFFAVTDSYDEPLAHLLFAGADAFSMPSHFEPCGLAQMQAMAYGTPTIATAVGGLVDTIIDIDADRKNGTGFLTTTNDLVGLVDATHRAVRALSSPPRRRAMQKRGMTTDWSWNTPARQHIELYRELQSKR